MPVISAQGTRSQVAEVRAPEGEYDVPPGQWPAFLRRFAERHAGVAVSIRATDGPLLSQREPRRRVPFHGARHGQRLDGREEILITVGEPPYMLESYVVVEPERVRVRQQAGRLSILIESRAGATLSLGFGEQVGRSTGPLTLLA
jgi:hypothetical protein